MYWVIQLFQDLVLDDSFVAVTYALPLCIRVYQGFEFDFLDLNSVAPLIPK